MKRYNLHMSSEESNPDTVEPVQVDDDDSSNPPETPPREIGGRKTGLDPTRYGDWEKNGRCIDF